MSSSSAARGVLLIIAGVWLLTRTFKGGLANRVGKAAA